MTRADFIRETCRLTTLMALSHEEIASRCAAAGFDRPSRQAIESALAKSGTRGRPSSRDKCPTCGQRTNLATVGHMVDLAPEGVVTGILTGFERIARPATAAESRALGIAVATMSQKPRTKRTRRTPKAPQSKRKAK